MNDLTKKAGRTPCYKCENRSSECHSSCESYAEWKNNYEKERKVQAERKKFERNDPRWGLMSDSKHNRMTARKKK